MLCDVCKKNEASVHMVSVINGAKQETHLCNECAGKQKKGNFSINDLISGFYDFYTPTSINTKSCSKCGMTFSNFKKYGKLGCASCYDAFRDELLPMLKGIHSGVQHTGRTLDADHNKKAGEIDGLRSKLNEAVRQENYEEAAKIRDEIKSLEG